MPSERFRQLPAIDQWLGSALGQALCAEFSREEVVGVMREHVAAAREHLTLGGSALPDFLAAEYEARLRAELLSRREPSLGPVINATGIVIHTNLGRAPLADEAIAAIAAVSQGYSNLEYDLVNGERGTRYAHVEPLIKRLTRAEAAIAVNNGAAAVTLVLKALAADGEVVVSRGELIEIGGSFRMPDVIAQSGARMREVGTTNRTTIADYEREMSADTRAILSSHPSNYRVTGFTGKPRLDELARLAHSKRCLLIQDLGSGSLVDLAECGLEAEPTVAKSIDAGVDIVTFSGDKLLGGPQAGIVCGKAELIAKLKRHPLLRAMRIDKLSLAGLAATLRLYLPPYDPFESIPVLRMLGEPAEAVGRRASALIGQWRHLDGLEASIVEDVSFAGGGSLPMNEIPTRVIRLAARNLTAGQLAARLREGRPPVVGRIKDGDFLIDLRTVAERDEAALTQAVLAALDGRARSLSE